MIDTCYCFLLLWSDGSCKKKMFLLWYASLFPLSISTTTKIKRHFGVFQKSWRKCHKSYIWFNSWRETHISDEYTTKGSEDTSEHNQRGLHQTSYTLQTKQHKKVTRESNRNEIGYSSKSAGKKGKKLKQIKWTAVTLKSSCKKSPLQITWRASQIKWVSFTCNT